MCTQDDTDSRQNDTSRNAKSAQHDFPWHLGAFDAHCHPTDTMASLSSIPAMKARALTIMATRSQDQDLVSQAAASLSPTEDSDSELVDLFTKPGGGGSCAVIPSFGWHPWFSHQLYDDLSPPSSSPGDNQINEKKANLESFEAKKAHYQAVLTPVPDEDFIQSLPTPTPISSFINSTRDTLLSQPIALVGEIGIDKAFRIPRQWTSSDAESRDDGLTPGGREGRTLSPHRVQIEHQQAILQHQLRLAGEVGRPVSVHGVQAHGVLFHTIKACWKGHEREVLSKTQQRRVAPGAEDFEWDSDSDSDAGPQGGQWRLPERPALCEPYPQTPPLTRQRRTTPGAARSASP